MNKYYTNKFGKYFTAKTKVVHKSIVCSFSELKYLDDALRLNPSNYAEILSLLIYIEDFTAQKEMYKYDLFVKNIYETIHSVGGNIFKYKV